jgi:hypothetical protein
MRNASKIVVGISKGETAIDGRTTLKWLFKKEGVKM